LNSPLWVQPTCDPWRCCFKNYITPKRCRKVWNQDANSMTFSAIFLGFGIFSRHLFGGCCTVSEFFIVFLVPFGERCEDVALTKLPELFYEKPVLFFYTLMMETALRNWSNRDRFPNAVHDKNRLRIILILVIWLFYTRCSFMALDALHSAAAASGAGHRWCGLVRQQWSRRRGSDNVPRPLVRPC
jgi:hypothetical protein